MTDDLTNPTANDATDPAARNGFGAEPSDGTDPDQQPDASEAGTDSEDPDRQWLTVHVTSAGALVQRAREYGTHDLGMTVTVWGATAAETLADVERTLRSCYRAIAPRGFARHVAPYVAALGGGLGAGAVAGRRSWRAPATIALAAVTGTVAAKLTAIAYDQTTYPGRSTVRYPEQNRSREANIGAVRDGISVVTTNIDAARCLVGHVTEALQRAATAELLRHPEPSWSRIRAAHLRTLPSLRRVEALLDYTSTALKAKREEL